MSILTRRAKKELTVSDDNVKKMDQEITEVERAAHVHLRGLAELRQERDQLREQVEDLDRAFAIEQSNHAATRALLMQAQAERDYYQRFSIEIATSLNLVGQICDEVMTKAQQEATRKTPVHAPTRQDIPEIKIPKFLQKGPAVGGELPGSSEPPTNEPK